MSKFTGNHRRIMLMASAGELVEAMVPITTHDGLADAFFFSRLLVSNILAMKDGQPYSLAGLWEKWKDRKAGTELLTFTVITTDPNSVVEPLHNRMPVIVPTRLRPLVES